jgi:hypothetical protein
MPVLWQGQGRDDEALMLLHLGLEVSRFGHPIRPQMVIDPLTSAARRGCWGMGGWFDKSTCRSGAAIHSAHTSHDGLVFHDPF